MTTKRAIIDLDGVVADNSVRMARAEQRRAWYRQHGGACLAEALAIPHQQASVQQGFEALLENLYWQTAFTPALVALDTLIPGADEAIVALEARDFQIIYLTSRPEALRVATQAWLHDAHLFGPQLVMKPPAAQDVKTTAWKALMVQMLATWTWAEDLLYIDDEPANLAELLKHAAPCARLRTAASLAAALTATAQAQQPGEDSDADLPF